MEQNKIVLTDIQNTLKQSNIEESFIESVLKRMDSFGILIKVEDAWMIGFTMQKVESHIKNACNTSSIPSGLEEVAVDRVCGEFLFAKKQSGTLEGFDLEAAVKQVSTGDTSVSFDVTQSPEQRFNALINFLMSQGEGEFACYRKIKW